MNLLWTPHNLASVGALRAQIPTTRDAPRDAFDHFVVRPVVKFGLVVKFGRFFLRPTDLVGVVEALLVRIDRLLRRRHDLLWALGFGFRVYEDLAQRHPEAGSSWPSWTRSS